MALKDRLDKLEELTGAADCPVCRDDGPIEVSVCWSDDATVPTGPEYCPACGRQLVFTVTWGESDEPQTAA